MNAPPDPGLDGLLERLETVIAKLADGSGPLDELVSAHEEATRLVDEAQARLRDLMKELDTDAPPQTSPGGRGSQP
ncbi:MAG TPA: exodeoxyribonuclease VII small subunit [Candidatus Dormibacteraeota bacterium]